MERLDDDIISLMKKRVYDLAGITDKRVKVKLNGKAVECKDFGSYCDLYLNSAENKELPKIAETKNLSDRWEVICSLSEGEFR
jgi:DNA topoisomerase-2